MFSKQTNSAKGSFYFGERDLKEAPDEYKSLVLYLEKKHRVISECFLDKNGFIRCIYLQDPYMKDLFHFYPDRICIDATYKYFDTDIFLYLFLIGDANGRHFIVSIGFSVVEDSESLTWLLNIFKKHNPNWRRIKMIVLDSEINEKDLLRNIFPNTYIMMCFHHASKSFKKGLNRINHTGNAPFEQIQIAFQTFKSMYHAHRIVEFEFYYQQFLLLHPSIVSYLQDTWMPIQHLWRTGLDLQYENLFNTLNVELECLDNSFKSLYEAEDNVLEFIRKSFVILSLKRIQKVDNNFDSDPLLYSQFSTEYHISKLVTAYAAKFIINQVHLSSEIHMDCSVMADNYLFDNFGSPVNASVSVCSCHFYLYTFLPCRHIFAVRKTLNLCMFEESLIDHSWSMRYFQNSLLSLESSLCTLSESSLPNSRISRNGVVSHLLQLPLKLESSKAVFESRIKAINQVTNLWKKDKDVHLNFVGMEAKDLGLTGSYYSENCLNMLPGIHLDECKSESPISIVHQNAPVRKSNYQTTCEAKCEQKWNFKSKLLDGKHINYIYLCRIICESTESCLNWLKEMELIPINVTCPKCEYEMVYKSMPSLSDGAIWICPNVIDKVNCSRRCSVRHGSWFELSNMTFVQILSFCYMWINGFSQNQIMFEAGISSTTYVTWNKLNERVCQEVLIEEGNFPNITKVNSSGCSEFLEMWVKNCADEDSFLKFLQDANSVHRKENLKRL